MTKPTNEERREVAAKLRAKHRERTRPGVFVPQDAGMQAWDYLRDLEACLPDGDSAFTVLADLIDPTCRACLDTLFFPATDLTPEREEDIYVCSECGEVLSYDEGFDPDTDYPAYCEACGSRVVGIGEPWNE